MTKDEFLNGYIAAFNRGDFDGFTRFYDQNVVLDLGGKRRLEGREAIRRFYTEVLQRIEETLTVDQLVLDTEGLACIVRTEFRAKDDWPDFIVGPMRRGESIFIESFIFYTIGANGKFTQIRTTRSRG
ncbi:MAG: nuclear transport factor 2 family protein [Gammaproteobacteria bacterium]|nr:nuclear transport factor 2 family protein [Gammaproteobacteria bacterium]